MMSEEKEEKYLEYVKEDDLELINNLDDDTKEDFMEYLYDNFWDVLVYGSLNIFNYCMEGSPGMEDFTNMEFDELLLYFDGSWDEFLNEFYQSYDTKMFEYDAILSEIGLVPIECLKELKLDLETENNLKFDKAIECINKSLERSYEFWSSDSDSEAYKD